MKINSSKIITVVRYTTLLLILFLVISCSAERSAIINYYDDNTSIRLRSPSGTFHNPFKESIIIIYYITIPKKRVERNKFFEKEIFTFEELKLSRSTHSRPFKKPIKLTSGFIDADIGGKILIINLQTSNGLFLGNGKYPIGW